MWLQEAISQKSFLLIKMRKEKMAKYLFNVYHAPGIVLDIVSFVSSSNPSNPSKKPGKFMF